MVVGYNFNDTGWVLSPAVLTHVATYTALIAGRYHLRFLLPLSNCFSAKLKFPQIPLFSEFQHGPVIVTSISRPVSDLAVLVSTWLTGSSTPLSSSSTRSNPPSIRSSPPSSHRTSSSVVPMRSVPFSSPPYPAFPCSSPYLSCSASLPLRSVILTPDLFPSAPLSNDILLPFLFWPPRLVSPRLTSSWLCSSPSCRPAPPSSGSTPPPLLSYFLPYCPCSGPPPDLSQSLCSQDRGSIPCI